MIYEILRPIVRLSLRAYFKRIDVHGKEHLSYKNLLLVSNHPSAMFDPLVVAVNSKKQLHFIAGAEWFGKGLKQWLFREHFNMIPVYRPWLASGQQKDNRDMFQECYVSLGKGETIIIYPEAESITVPWIRELKTGAARIKAGADAYLKKENIEGDVKVVPIGLNYTNPHRFQSRLLINVGEPVDFSRVDQSGDPKEVAREMTECIHEAMQDQVLHIQEEEHFPVIKAAIKLLTDAILDEIGVKKNDHVQAFVVQKGIIESMERIKKENPEQLKPLEQRMMDYVERFEAHGFHRFNPFETKASTRWLLWLGVALCAPLFSFSLIVNGIPFLISRGAFNSMIRSQVTREHKQGQINPAFAGSLAYAVGLAVFLIWYIGLAILVSLFSPWWLGWPLSWIVGFQLGKFALTYVRWWRRVVRIRKWNILEKKNPTEADSLLKERKELLDSLMKLYKGASA